MPPLRVIQVQLQKQKGLRVSLAHIAFLFVFCESFCTMNRVGSYTKLKELKQRRKRENKRKALYLQSALHDGRSRLYRSQLVNFLNLMIITSSQQLPWWLRSKVPLQILPSNSLQQIYARIPEGKNFLCSFTFNKRIVLLFLHYFRKR